MDPGRELRAARRQAGLTQAQLAERAGTSQATISAYETLAKQPSIATLSRLLSAAGARLTVERGLPPVVQPSPDQHASVSRTLLDVLALAEALPTRYEPGLRFPSLKAR